MTVTKIEPVSKTRFKVYVDEKPVFVLYKGELSRYHIEADEEIEDEVFEDILNTVVCKRAKARALHLLNDMGRTEAQLRTKLGQGGYTEEIVEEAIAYVKSFGYLNDWDYARSLIEGRKHKKSRMELYGALLQKGVAKEEAERALEEYYDSEDSKAAIEAILKKKKFVPESADRIQKQKMGSYLMRKGFKYEEIRKILQFYD